MVTGSKELIYTPWENNRCISEMSGGNTAEETTFMVG